MKKFARIIDLPKTQCLIVIEYDDEEDAFKANVSMDIRGVMATVGFGFHKESQAYSFMNKYTAEDALTAYEATEKMLSGDE